MLNFSTWKITTIIGACLMGFWFTAPNFLNDDQLVDLPDWMPKQQINLGLDLQGGVHLLWEVDIEGVNEQELVQLRATVPDVLRDAGVRRFKRPVIRNDAVQVRISDSAKVDQAVDALEEFSQPVNTALGTFKPSQLMLQVTRLKCAIPMRRSCSAKMRYWHGLSKSFVAELTKWALRNQLSSARVMTVFSSRCRVLMTRMP